jgi:hypothetical protein
MSDEPHNKPDHGDQPDNNSKQPKTTQKNNVDDDSDDDIEVMSVEDYKTDEDDSGTDNDPDIAAEQLSSDQYTSQRTKICKYARVILNYCILSH